MKKLLSIALVVVLLAGIAVSGTMAYLQDSDSDVNVMTLGNVDIEQHEYEREVNADGNYVTDTIDDVTSYVLKDFTQGKPLVPSALVTNGPGWDWDDTATVRMTQVGSYGGMDVFVAASNAQDKFVTVENTGRTDAYIRTLVAIEIGSTNGSLIGTSYHGTWAQTEIGEITIDGNKYVLIEYAYEGGKLTDGTWRHQNGILPAGDTSYPNLSQVYLSSEATNEDMELIDGNKNGMLDILVVSQAVQAEGFADAETALNAGFGDITTTNHPWLNTKTNAETATSGSLTLDSDYILTDKPLYSNHEATESYTIDGNGHTVTGVATSVDVFTWEGGTIPAMSAIFSSADGSKVTVNDLKFTGTMSSIMLGHYVDSSSNWYNTELNDVDVIGTEVVSFSANIAPAVTVYGTAVLNNCNIYGTKLSALDTDPMWPVYDLAVVNYSDTTLNNSKVGSIYVWNQAKVTVAAGSEVDTMVIRGNMNTTKYGVTIKDGATVDTIDLSAIADKNRVNFTIEDGATVGKIVANGAEYASIADWQNA